MLLSLLYIKPSWTNGFLHQASWSPFYPWSKMVWQYLATSTEQWFRKESQILPSIEGQLSEMKETRSQHPTLPSLYAASTSKLPSFSQLPWLLPQEAETLNFAVCHPEPWYSGRGGLKIKHNEQANNWVRIRMMQSNGLQFMTPSRCDDELQHDQAESVYS